MWVETWQWIGRASVGSNLLTYVTAVMSAAAIIITATRKRKDADLNEMKRRIVELVKRVELLETDLTSTRSELIDAEQNVFVLRRTLATHGIADPTERVS